jgi:hypothetical protein
MKETSRNAIREGLAALLAELQKTPVPQEGHWEYRRDPSGSWQGTVVPKPGTFALFPVHDDLTDQLAAKLGIVLAVDYPDHLKVVGTSMGAGVLDPRTILTGLAYESLKRYGTFSMTNDQMEELLVDVAGFFDRTTVRLRLYAPALNLHGSRAVPSIAFSGNVTLRPIADEEFTLIYGGNSIFPGHGRLLNFPDFVFVREIEVPKVIGSYDGMAGDLIWKPTQDILDRCILALASFKDAGAVGYDGVRVTPAELTLGSAFGMGHMWGNEHVPTARYDISAEEAPRIEAYAKNFENIHSSLEMACQRLVDSARRTKPRDSVVDAVIGLESILLVDIGEKQRGETRFRFALNYASLFSAAERKLAFNTARDLYDLRSAIAHGGSPQAKVKIDGKEMTLYEAAIRARTVLRETLSRFMPNSVKPEFLTEGYWITKALGL